MLPTLLLAAGLLALLVAPTAAACPPLPGPADAPLALAGPAASGQPLGIAWTDPWGAPPAALPAAEPTQGVRPAPGAAPDAAPAAGCARFLLLALPERARLSGTGFYALAPGEPAPFGLALHADRLRLVIPLHDAAAPAGALTLTPFWIGPDRLDWSLVQIPVAGGRAGTPRIHRGAPLPLDVAVGPPRIVVQDPFDTETPQETILSNSGAFLLEVFPGRFRVRDAASGALIHDGIGEAPNFSPTSRFVHALGAAQDGEVDTPLYSDLTVIDLFAEAPALVIDRGGFAGRGSFLHTLHWSPGDSFLAIGYTGDGGLAVVQTLLDGRPPVENHWGCGGCAGETDGRIALHLSDGVVRFGTLRDQDELDLADPARIRWQEIGGPPLPPAGFGLGAAQGAEAAGHRWDFDLAGAAGRSWRFHDPELHGPDRPVVVAHRRLDTPPDLPPVEASLTERGAQAMGEAPAINRAGRLAQRLGDLGILTRSRAPLFADTIVGFWHDETLPDEIDWPAPCEATLPALRLGLIDAAAAEALCAAAEAMLWEEAVEYCPPVAHAVWTRAVPGGAEILHQALCRLGTGVFPAGHLARLRSTPAGPEAELLALTGNLHPDYWESDDPDPGPRGPLPLPVQAPLHVAAVAPDLWAIAGVDRRIRLVVPDTLQLVGTLEDGAPPEAIAELALTAEGTHLFQLDRDGRFFLHDLGSGTRSLSGVHVDDEVVAFDAGLNFEATPEGARHVHLRFPGDAGLYSLDQLGAARASPGVVRETMAGRPRPAPRSPGLPPRIAAMTVEGDRVRAAAQAAGGLAHVALWRDGVEVAQRAVSGAAAELVLDLPALPETRWFALRATDARGLTSQVRLIPRSPAPDAAPRGRLFVLAVGTDRYADPGIPALGFAAADARGFAAALAAGASPLYAAVEAEVIADSEDLARDLPARLAALAARAGPEDTVFLHIAGHGLIDAAGGLRLADAGTRLDDLAGSALGFDALAAALLPLRARVVVFLDACHSGAADVATNDDAVAALLAEGRPLAVLAAAKGRQVSFEAAEFGGGAFTAALIRALTGAGGADLDGNGAVELSELYAAVKRDVVRRTFGEQTPWIARSGFVGEVPLH